MQKQLSQPNGSIGIADSVEFALVPTEPCSRRNVHLPRRNVEPRRLFFSQTWTNWLTETDDRRDWTIQCFFYCRCKQGLKPHKCFLVNVIISSLLSMSDFGQLNDSKPQLRKSIAKTDALTLYALELASVSRRARFWYSNCRGSSIRSE